MLSHNIISITPNNANSLENIQNKLSAILDKLKKYDKIFYTYYNILITPNPETEKSHINYVENHQDDYISYHNKVISLKKTFETLYEEITDMDKNQPPDNISFINQEAAELNNIHINVSEICDLFSKILENAQSCLVFFMYNKLIKIYLIYLQSHVLKLTNSTKNEYIECLKETWEYFNHLITNKIFPLNFQHACFF